MKMDGPRPCGCKGCRTCLVCEKEFNINEKPYISEYKVWQHTRFWIPPHKCQMDEKLFVLFCFFRRRWKIMSSVTNAIKFISVMMYQPQCQHIRITINRLALIFQAFLWWMILLHRMRRANWWPALTVNHGSLHRVDVASKWVNLN